MTRITEINCDDESEVIPRLMLQVHKAVDKAFPHVTPATSKFSQTVFNQSEDTVVDRPAAPPEPEIEADQDPMVEEPDYAHSAINEMVNSGHEPTEHSKLEQHQVRPKPSLAIKIFRLTLLILIFAALSAYWAFKNLV